MLNSLSLSGYVDGEVLLVFDDNKKAYKATFRLININNTGKKIYNNEFHVVVYGQKAEQCAKKLKDGSKASVCGKVNMVSRPDDSGNKKLSVVVNATEVFFE